MKVIPEFCEAGHTSHL